MDTVIGVQFERHGKLYYFDANGFEVQPGQFVVVDTARGYDLGEVILANQSFEDGKFQVPLKKTIRIATEHDIQHGRENRVKEKDAFLICQRKIAEHQLEMKLVSVEYAFDNSKILFFFTANGRVDFRSLVKDLASVFKMRIELRQIGVRDEAKMLGGLGPCGRPICCGAFLDQFQPVSIKMAKEQNLSLNPTKISGVCGRLMCCLKYEQEHYELTRKKMPKIGREVSTPDGTGTVTELNIVKETVFVRLTNGDTSEIKEFPLEEINKKPEKPFVPDANAQKENRPADTTEIKTRSAVTPKPSGQSSTDGLGNEQEQIGKPDNGTGEPRKDKNGRKTRKGVLGQPVKRENSKKAPVSRQEEERKPAPDQKLPVEAASEQNSDRKSAWSDALQKAMKAVSESK